MIDILLSTYNGALYIGQQIESIINQTCTDWILTIRDDGSTDNTVAVIESYAKLFPDKIRLLQDNSGNIGYKRSFEKLLSSSSNGYVMFCDQDDVWLTDKISRTFEVMIRAEQQYGNDTPILVHTDLTVVDQNLKELHPSFAAYTGFDPNVIDKNIYYLGICNTTTGCTTLFNRALARIALPFYHDAIHDEWVAICAKKYGQIIYLPQSTILYRQHNANTIGVKDNKFSLTNRIAHLKKVYTEMMDKYRHTRRIIYPNFFVFLWYKIVYTIRYRL